jgi:hypothetical protein
VANHLTTHAHVQITRDILIVSGGEEGSSGPQATAEEGRLIMRGVVGRQRRQSDLKSRHRHHPRSRSSPSNSARSAAASNISTEKVSTMRVAEVEITSWR